MLIYTNQNKLKMIEGIKIFFFKNFHTLSLESHRPPCLREVRLAYLKKEKQDIKNRHSISRSSGQIETSSLNHVRLI